MQLVGSIFMHPRDECMCSSDSRLLRRSQGFVKAIYQEPLIRMNM